ncbi:hypothetical protein P3X46_006982 [Hevea brasiliensis]|uniref:USP domain-containing protein n=1 Tax=Hevea brasiliensis TaxID=3981 RepID=A0ABQ9MSF0_HEVBR|nr:hypothetical protein P3X46_006982 [Hevea brasiliensis]
MENINCQIGGGSQEDAHEFLRLLVASTQSICLEGLGGEDKVNPILQETTFILHTFGGRLTSKVKCLRCHHESERYENLMDLTLEIFGWVESLEDALTQFTTPEELDGENMYRCGRCTTYVQAAKQLSIHEAPNILTIVLKRFQEGKYGKINKSITFPDMLDMIPFMTGAEDIPPLYMLYAVVVHLDTLNASFSGHYLAYVHPVPMSQVMSEGAYILFYIRKNFVRNLSSNKFHHLQDATHHQGRRNLRERDMANQAATFLAQSHHCISNQKRTCSINHTNGILGSTNRNVAQAMEFSDATSSDWSLSTSSDETSFTTESTRDSFSTMDYTDTCNADTFSSIFSNLYAPVILAEHSAL